MYRALILLTLTCSVYGQINIAFHNGTTTVNAMTTRPDGTIVATSTDFWNNPARNGTNALGLIFTGVPLSDISGTDTGATLDVNSGQTAFNNNGWNANTQDHVMMEGWYGFRDTESLTINNIPAGYTEGGYVVTIYGNSGGAPRTMNYTVNGTTKTIENTALFNGTFTLDSNFQIFSGFNSSTLTITGNSTGVERSSINGIRIEAAAIAPLDIADFSADSLFVAPGNPVTLNWDVISADSLTLDPGNIDVTGTTSRTLTLTEDTTYTLTASETNNPTPVTASLTVRTAPVLTSVNSVPKIARDAADIRIVWEQTGASTITINDGIFDIFTTSDPAVIALGFTTLTNVTVDTTFTVTTSFPGSGAAQLQTSIEIRSGADPVSLEETLLAANPIAYYRFEEMTGSTQLLDHSGNLYDSLTVGAGVSPAQIGAVGNAWTFQDSSVQLSLNPDPTLSDLSISLITRIDPREIANTNSFVSQQDLDGGLGRSLLQTAVVDGEFSSWIGGGRKDLDAIPAVDDWCHVVLVSDIADQELRFYVNGILTATRTEVVTESTLGNYILGANKTQTTQFLHGAMDELAVFDYQLDDPNGDSDGADGLVPSHYNAYLDDALPLLGFSGVATIDLGQSTPLNWKVGNSATTITIDNGVGDVTALTSNGTGTINVSPSFTRTYTITVNGTETREVLVTVISDLVASPTITSAFINESNQFELTATKLTEGVVYSLVSSPDLESAFTSTGVTVVADASGEATFIDPLNDITVNTKKFYRIEEVVDP